VSQPVKRVIRSARTFDEQFWIDINIPCWHSHVAVMEWGNERFAVVPMLETAEEIQNYEEKSNNALDSANKTL